MLEKGPCPNECFHYNRVLLVLQGIDPGCVIEHPHPDILVTNHVVAFESYQGYQRCSWEEILKFLLNSDFEGSIIKF